MLKHILCGKGSPSHELTSPQDEHSWITLYEAAAVRQFEPAISLAKGYPNKAHMYSVIDHADLNSLIKSL